MPTPLPLQTKKKKERKKKNRPGKKATIKKKLNSFCTLSPFGHESLSSMITRFTLPSVWVFFLDGPPVRFPQLSGVWVAGGTSPEAAGGNGSEGRCANQASSPLTVQILMSHFNFRKRVNLKGA